MNKKELAKLYSTVSQGKVSQKAALEEINVFTSSGINQTLHQVMLNVQVECTLLIPGGTVDTVVEAQVCAAETLLVGQVPDTYLELPGGL